MYSHRRFTAVVAVSQMPLCMFKASDEFDKPVSASVLTSMLMVTEKVLAWFGNGTFLPVERTEYRAQMFSNHSIRLPSLRSYKIPYFFIASATNFSKFGVPNPVTASHPTCAGKPEVWHP